MRHGVAAAWLAVGREAHVIFRSSGLRYRCGGCGRAELPSSETRGRRSALAPFPRWSGKTSSPAAMGPCDARAGAGSTETPRVHRQPRPDRAGSGRRGARVSAPPRRPPWRGASEREGTGRGEEPAGRGREAEASARRTGRPDVCTWGDEGLGRGGGTPRGGPPALGRRLRQPQPRGTHRSPPRWRGSGEHRLIAKRPSDRRSPGRNPGPQGAFEVSMINVSCNSH